MSAEVTSVHSEQRRQVGARRVTENEDLVGIAAMLTGMRVEPREGRRRVLDVIRMGGRPETVVRHRCTDALGRKPASVG